MAIQTVLNNDNKISNDMFIAKGMFNLSIIGTFNAKITIQRSFNENEWLDIDVFEEPGEFCGNEGEGCRYRAIIKDGDWISGDINIRINN